MSPPNTYSQDAAKSAEALEQIRSMLSDFFPLELVAPALAVIEAYADARIRVKLNQILHGEKSK
jgi:hypothetical protein